MNKITVPLLAIFALITAAALTAFPAFAEDTYPRFVVWESRADLYPDAQLAEKADRLPDAVAPGDVIVLLGRSSGGNFNVCAIGVKGWVKPAPYMDAALAVCTGDNVNVRSAPKTGKADRRQQLDKGEAVLVIGKKNLGEQFPWYRIKMFSTHECWVYGQFLAMSSPIEQSAAAELRCLEEAANERQDMQIEAIKSAGIKRGDQANSLRKAAGVLRGAGWIGPAELRDGDNRYLNILRTMQEKIPSVLHIKVTGGRVSDIAFAPRRQ